MEQRNYEKLLPLQPDAKAIAWARKKSGCDGKHLSLIALGHGDDPTVGFWCEGMLPFCNEALDNSHFV